MHPLFVVASAREGGNTEQLARLAAESLPSGSTATWLRLVEHPLEPFVDRRHDGVGFGPLDAAAQRLVEATLAATDVVFVAPVYWYGLPASAKLYLDHWSHWMRMPELAFKERMRDKGLWLVTCNSDAPGGDDESTDALVLMLERTARYMHMVFRGALVGHGNRPGDVLQDRAAVAAAHTFFALRSRTPKSQP
jgi:multimeric flavodoxin WrbA